MDADGFQLVQPRGRRPRAATAGAGAARPSPNGVAAVVDDVLGEDGRDGADAAGGDDEDDPEDEGCRQPEPSALRRAWQDEIGLVKRMAQQGLAATHPAMVAACKARDEAERAWREAKEPTPASIRLSRAQAKLDKAIAAQADIRTEMLEFDQEVAFRREALSRRMDEATERVRTRRRQLEEVQDDIGNADGRTRESSDAAIKKVYGSLANEIAPTIAALVDQLDTGAPAWGALNGVLSALATSKSLLEQAVAPVSSTQSFNIVAGDNRDEDGDAAGSQAEGSEWSESHELVAAAGGDGIGLAAREQQDPAHDHDMGSGSWWDGPAWHGGTKWHSYGHGKWERQSWADSWEEECPAEDAGSETRAAKSRKTGEQAEATGAQGAVQATPTDPAATAAEAKRLYDERLSYIITAAVNTGVQPVTDTGEDIRLLDPHQLDAWVEQHMPPNW